MAAGACSSEDSNEGNTGDGNASENEDAGESDEDDATRTPETSATSEASAASDSEADDSGSADVDDGGDDANGEAADIEDASSPSSFDAGLGDSFDAASNDEAGADRAASAQDSGAFEAAAASPPLYEQLDCDLPAVMSYCGGSSCHYDTSSQEVGSSLALWNRDEQRLMDGLEASLINKPAEYHNVLSGDCPSEPELLVDTSDVERSLILKKLLGTQSCGDDMPKFPYPEWGTVANPAPGRDEFIDCIRQWLTLLVDDYNQSR
jgi:hypothetical protein